MKIGSYEAAGGWKQMEGYLDGIRKVTRDDIRRVARQYLKTDTRTVGTLIPTKDPMKQVCLSLWVFLALVRGPVSAEAGMTAKRTVLNNGMVLLTSEQRALPMVSIELLIDAGSRYEAADQAGLANLTSKLLIYGTKQRTAVQISDTLDFIGAEFGGWMRSGHDQREHDGAQKRSHHGT